MPNLQQIADAVAHRLLATITARRRRSKVYDGSVYTYKTRTLRGIDAYKLDSNLQVICPRCKHRANTTELVIVSSYTITIPLTYSCRECGGIRDEDGEVCHVCSGKGFIVYDTLEVPLDMVCLACVAELRAARTTVVYTTTGRAGEPTHRREKDYLVKNGSKRLRPMCTCQQRYARRGGLCSICKEEELRSLRHKVKAIEGLLTKGGTN